MRTDSSPPLTEEEIWVRFDRLVAMRDAARAGAEKRAAAEDSLNLPGLSSPVIEIESAPTQPMRAPAVSAVVSGALGGLAALALAMVAIGVVAMSGSGSHQAAAAPQVAAAPPTAPIVPAHAAPAVAVAPDGPTRLSSAPAAPVAPSEASRSPAATPARMDEATARLAQLSPAERNAAPAVRRGAASAGGRVILRASGQVDTGEAVAALKAAGVSEVRMRHTRVSALTVQARFFHRQDRARAAAMLKALGSPAAPSDFTHLRPAPPRGVVEVLLPTPHDVAMRAGRNNSFN